MVKYYCIESKNRCTPGSRRSNLPYVDPNTTSITLLYLSLQKQILIQSNYMTKHRAFLMEQQHKEYCQLAHSALARAVWDDELKKLVSYKELLNHRNSIIWDRWTKGGENKIRRLFQAFSSNGIDGLDVLEWIKKNQVPRDKTVTYPRYTASLWPEKEDKPH